MSKVDKRALRELAEKATPGPWVRGNGNDVSVSESGDEAYWEWEEAGPAQFHDARGQQASADADFCAAANPATVLALLDEIEALRTCLAETAGVAVTMLYESHKADTLKEFSIEELSRMVDSAKHLADANVRVEKIYRKAWDMAQGGTDHG